MERYYFGLREQGKDESVEEFITSLRKLASSCKFGELVEERIRDQFVLRCSSDKIREELWLKDELPLDEVMGIAKHVEHMLKCVGELSKVSKEYKPNQKVEEVECQVVQKVDCKKKNDENAQGKGIEGECRTDNLQQRRKSVMSFQGNCYRCGRFGHMVNAKECPALRVNCSVCGKRGHYWKNCHLRNRRDFKTEIKEVSFQIMPLILREQTNQTSSSEFFLMGFSSYPQLQSAFFAVFLLLYLLAVIGNILIITIISSDAHLHTPMYFFLTNLAVLDICFTSCISPKILNILLSETKSISYIGCMTQQFLLSSTLGSELILLAVMAFDRFVAICMPLYYPIIMCKKIYTSLAAAVWLVGMLNSMFLSGLLLNLSFSETIILDHFFCEIPALLKASISDIHLLKSVTLVEDFFFGIFCFFCIIISYTYILASIVRIHSAEKKRKAFSTCASHLLVVTLYYVSTIYAYVLPSVTHGSKGDKVASALYAIISPVLNPMIYSMRNTDVKQAFFKILSRHIFP
ncbi:olfactory receptor 2B6-like [Lissotriton helveticus]